MNRMLARTVVLAIAIVALMTLPSTWAGGSPAASAALPTGGAAFPTARLGVPFAGRRGPRDAGARDNLPAPAVPRVGDRRGAEPRLPHRAQSDPAGPLREAGHRRGPCLVLLLGRRLGRAMDDPRPPSDRRLADLPAPVLPSVLRRHGDEGLGHLRVAPDVHGPHVPAGSAVRRRRDIVPRIGAHLRARQRQPRERGVPGVHRDHDRVERVVLLRSGRRAELVPGRGEPAPRRLAQHYVRWQHEPGRRPRHLVERLDELVGQPLHGPVQREHGRRRLRAVPTTPRAPTAARCNGR